MTHLKVVNISTKPLINSYHHRIGSYSRGQDFWPPPVCARGPRIPAWTSNHGQSEEVVQQAPVSCLHNSEEKYSISNKNTSFNYLTFPYNSDFYFFIKIFLHITCDFQGFWSPKNLFENPKWLVFTQVTSIDTYQSRN